MVHLDYRDARPIYTQIVDNYKSRIATGILQSGEKLPSVRELAGELAINPNTIQRAYRELENEGFIYSITGKGSFVAPLHEVDHSRRDGKVAEFRAAALELMQLGMTKAKLTAMLEELEQEGNHD